METIDKDNCLHLIVSSNFLGLKEIYEKVWRLYFMHYFNEVIDSC